MNTRKVRFARICRSNIDKEKENSLKKKEIITQNEKKQRQ
jgi:hypothetical protein